MQQQFFFSALSRESLIKGRPSSTATVAEFAGEHVDGELNVVPRCLFEVDWLCDSTFHSKCGYIGFSQRHKRVHFTSSAECTLDIDEEQTVNSFKTNARTF